MTEAERFTIILDELGSLIALLGWYCDDVVLIGGQVLAVEQVAVGEDPVLHVETDTGQKIERGYSFDPDLLIQPLDVEESGAADDLPRMLRDAGYHRTRDFQWEKQVGEVPVRVDLFMPDGGPEPPTGMTRLPRGEKVLSRATRVRVPVGQRGIDVKLPSIVDFVMMKVDAYKLRHEFTAKDAFDLYAYVRKKTPAVVGQELASAPEREEALAELNELFGNERSPGVVDVVSFAPSLEGTDRLLVTKDVVRTFADVRRVALGTPGP